MWKTPNGEEATNRLLCDCVVGQLTGKMTELSQLSTLDVTWGDRKVVTWRVLSL